MTQQSSNSVIIVDNRDSHESLKLRIHPRVFTALGKDLITNDVVAVIELVKNSYDAFANNVWLTFGYNGSERPYIEIEDDGIGMTREIIENEWCYVATTYKKTNPVVKRNGNIRRVVGNKGLGRLSVARLGDRLTMLTQATQSPCWEVTVCWPEISEADDLSQSTVKCREYDGESPFPESGTRLLIMDLNEKWDKGRIEDLAENLGRLLSPFNDNREFNIFLSGFDSDDANEISVEPPGFLSEPKYGIKGEVDQNGNVSGNYRFLPLNGSQKTRTEDIKLAWEQIYDQAKNSWHFQHDAESAKCGPFSFEIRAWDINAEGTKEIFDKYSIARRSIRKAIHAHKGISVYRDNVLVLPKSEEARDWLGLDLRRVSRIGSRLSTSQIVGSVAISAERNPEIEDTSDRERLSMCPEVEEFQEIIMAIVRTLENERDEDRMGTDRETPLTDLFATLSAKNLTEKATELAQSGVQASRVVPLIRQHSEELERNVEKIQERFVYYSRLATVGTIAQMLVHEIRNRTTIITRALRLIKNEFSHLNNRLADEQRVKGEEAVKSLERLADTFSPLASRNFRRRKRYSVLEEHIHDCLSMQEGDLKGKSINYAAPNTKTSVATDPSELEAIILNLITNSSYWLTQVPKEDRRIEFSLEPTNDGKRVKVWVHDTGPGIDDEDAEKIFWPGVTRKPGGIGMGLTVASELVTAYGGQMRIMNPGVIGGASFAFDLPCVKDEREGQK